MKILNSAGKLLNDAVFLFRTRAPGGVYGGYVRTFLKLKMNRKAGAGQIAACGERLNRQGRFSKDWFDANIPIWLALIAQFGLREKEIRALEIGCWEGRSALFLLDTLPKARLTAVDTWEGSEENDQPEILSALENNFDANLQQYRDRLEKFKGTSFSYFQSCEGRKDIQFDFMYIDGSHHADDVMCDAIKGFAHLKVGGIAIFDDYLWRYYDRPRDNPAGAINAFLRMKQGTYELLAVHSQIAIRKTR